VGLVLQGELEIDFKGALVRYQKGVGIAIPGGPGHGHRARSVTPRFCCSWSKISEGEPVPWLLGRRGTCE
jgi:quercetin dioxygenase-like cupin family protein